ncbi:CotH kinase family protein [Herbivorax sp. ANBcel31]|uniref:CotH kinase family protein n=1 Tax=Herbivorax sp. ANBcel31 TaxID=3069754 RepID=UPI0027B58DC3|nr:CotH kinase family protein [Herbivorax sp. ANBcel31]MDQ2086999.1 CotH kinase family protein [Herbivorax sp. ANBcel31]
MKKIVSGLVISAMLLFSMMGYMFDVKVYGQTEIMNPVFSHEGGFYSSPFTLEIASMVAPNNLNYTIYYTTDGSEPSPGSSSTNEYSNGIQITDRSQDPNVFSMIEYQPPGYDGGGGDWGFGGGGFNPDAWREPDGLVFKSTPVRAVAVASDGTTSDIITHTYFVDPNMSSRYRLPVISVTTDADSFFHEETGIFMGHNVESRGIEWERPVHVELFEEDGTLGLAQNAGARVHGGHTRNFQQKTLRLYARRDYDDQHWFEYEFFPGYEQTGTGEQMDRHKRLILRNSGNDWKESMIRDGLMQTLMMHMSHDLQGLRQSVVFINGEFWGIANIRERFCHRYVQSHFPDIDNDRVAMLDVKPTQEFEIDSGSQADLDDYVNNVIRYVERNDMSRSEPYETIKERIDIETFLDHYTSQIYLSNTDWHGNNKVIWRYNTESGSYEPDAPYALDGRWRFAIKDTDFGFDLSYGGDVDTDMIRHATSTDGGFGHSSATWPDSAALFDNLLHNQEFRFDFINRLSDHLNTAFTPERANNVIDELSGNISYAIDEHNARWNHIIQNWNEEISILRNFADNRVPHVRQHVQHNFGNDVNGEATINVSTDRSRGFVRVNSIDINESTPGVYDSSSWSGVYFDGVPITVTAVPEEGYEFERWEGVSGVNQESETITFNPQNNMTISPVFTEKSIDDDEDDDSSVLVGDINGDGIIDSTDYVLLSRYILDISDIPVDNKLAVADLNSDGVIDSTDCVILQRYLLDTIQELPLR